MHWAETIVSADLESGEDQLKNFPTIICESLTIPDEPVARSLQLLD